MNVTGYIPIGRPRTKLLYLFNVTSLCHIIVNYYLIMLLRTHKNT
jgi:hypothetical protein